MFPNLKEIEELVAKNGGRFLVFEEGKPKLVILDPEKYPKLAETGKKDGKGKILVTGGAGYIGSHTVAMLLKQGHDVLVYDNLSTGVSSNVNCPLIVGDLSDTVLLDKVFSENQIDMVMHFAASIIVEESVQHPEKYFQNNVINSLNLLNSMVKHGVKKFVFSSSAAVYGSPDHSPIDEEQPTNPANPYGESKLIFEKILKWYGKVHGVSSVIFRYFNAAGVSPDLDFKRQPGTEETHLIPRIFKVACREEESLKIFGGDYPTVDGTAVRDYIHVLDIATAHTLAVKKLESDQGSFIYNIGTGQGFSVAQMVDAFMDVTGKMVVIEQSPRRAGDPAALVADNKKIRDELGFTPQYSDLPSIITTAWNSYLKSRRS
jgi:UDP-glucose 4-epimerase